MNYRAIILNSKSQIDKRAYFITEYEKIESSRNAPSFFPNCRQVIDDLRKEINESFLNDEKILIRYIDLAKQNRIPFNGGAGENVGTQEWIINENKKARKYYENLLSNLDVQTYNPIKLRLGISLKTLLVIESELIKAIDAVNTYCIGVCFSDEEQKNKYDVIITRETNRSFLESFVSEDECISEMMYKLNSFIFSNKQITFEVNDYLDYHSEKSNLSLEKFKKYFSRVFKSNFDKLPKNNSKVEERALEVNKWLGLGSKNHTINDEDEGKIELDNFKTNISNAGTLSFKEKRSILDLIREGTNEIYKPLSVKCGISGLDHMIYGMLSAALEAYVYFHKKTQIETPIWKLQYINALEKKHEITNDWVRQINGQANFLLINFGDTEARQFTKVVESVFMQIDSICRSYSGHNFNYNLHKTLFDKCLENLEIEYNTEAKKLKTPDLIKAPQQVKKITELSAFEIALRHWYLVEGRIENYIIPKQVGEKYSHLKDKTNIAKSYSSIDRNKSTKKGNKQQLLKIRTTLAEYPLIQKAIDNSIDL